MLIGYHIILIKSSFNKQPSTNIILYDIYIDIMFEDTSPTFEINDNQTGESPAPLPLKPLPMIQRTRQKYRMRNNDHESMRY